MSELVMPMERTIPLELTGQGDHHSTGQAILRQLDDATRWKRALRSAGIVFGIAVACLPIPPLHWFITPTFLIASVVLLVRRLGQGTVIGGGGGPCPQCGKAIELEVQTPHWPLETVCPHCRRSVVMRPVAPARPTHLAS